ncbi:hypothetical protein RSOLAG1IB_04289 [Rhizoctonia solani AG-1 IB]|uniref:F-box domain-containing protein n=1 Tax=Thanatephorus cucumeris (strain AG1-IB / isolate 7/3/14) TaxID=1108050 RepID=A0A0B7FW02_THACB|nr:hypothetical protein RSOLAG1IB_04289 [Rhizoctonia solani AG-1 IB]
MPSLEHFELQHNGTEHGWSGRGNIGSSNKPLFHTPPARLKVAILEQIQSSRLFTSPECPQLVGLTCLKLKLAPVLPSLEGFNALLAASPMLEILSIDLRYQRRDSFPSASSRPGSNPLPKVKLPNLRSLGLLFRARPYSIDWEYDMLRMLDAPNVRFLRFRLLGWSSKNKDVVDYLAKGSDLSNPRPLFPLLVGLDIFVGQWIDQYLLGSGFYLLYEVMFTAYPFLTTLTLLGRAWSDVFELRQWSLPNLERLLVDSASPLGLKAFINGRHDAGLGLETLEILLVSKSHREHIMSQFKEALDGLGVDVRFCHTTQRAHEIMGLEDW